MKHLVLFLMFVLLTASGFSQWNSNTSTNLEIAGLNASTIQTAATSEGKTFIAFYSSVGGNFNMRVQLLDKDGNKLFGPDGIVANNFPTGSSTSVYNVCLGPENTFIIACQDQRNTSNGAVLIKVNQDGTLPWGMGGIYLGEGLSPYAVLLSSGDILVAWNNTNKKVIYQKVSPAGVLAWPVPKLVQFVVGGTVYNSTAAVPVALPSGGFTMLLQRYSSGISSTLYAQRYNNNGDSLWTNYLQLSNQATATIRTYSVATEADTIYYGYYSSVGSRFNSFVQRINPDGMLPWGINGAPFSTYSGTQPYNQTTNIAHAPGSPYIWSVCSYSNSGQSQWGIYVQKFDAVTGARLFNVDGKEVYPISAASDRQEGNLALINDAPLFMSYDVNYKMYATRLDANGNFVWIGNRVELSSTTAGGSTAKGRFNFTTAVNNQAVAVWYENRGTEYRGYAQNITGAGTTGPLPVRLSGLSAVRKGTQIDVSWKTVTEANNSGFYVQRSNDGINFTDLNFVRSKAINGYSNEPLQYTLIDFAPEKGNNYYRLRQTDKDGKATYSLVVLVKETAEAGLFITGIYPNPVKSILNFSVNTITTGLTFLQITDLKGHILKQQQLQLQTGSTALQMDVDHLPAGSYFLRMVTGSQTVIKKWMKQ